MADHRRVEPRSVVGTGMATDPERVQDIEDEAARRERAWREHGELGFGDVLKTAPARGQLADEPDPEETPARAPRSAEGAEQSGASDVAEAAAPARKQPPVRTGPRVPPDPRARALHQMLGSPKGAAAQRAMPPASETPPTGSVKSSVKSSVKKPPE